MASKNTREHRPKYTNECFFQQSSIVKHNNKIIFFPEALHMKGMVVYTSEGDRSIGNQKF